MDFINNPARTFEGIGFAATALIFVILYFGLLKRGLKNNLCISCSDTVPGQKQRRRPKQGQARQQIGSQIRFFLWLIIDCAALYLALYIQASAITLDPAILYTGVAILGGGFLYAAQPFLGNFLGSVILHLRPTIHIGTKITLDHIHKATITNIEYFRIIVITETRETYSVPITRLFTETYQLHDYN